MVRLSLWGIEVLGDLLLVHPRRRCVRCGDFFVIELGEFGRCSVLRAFDAGDFKVECFDKDRFHLFRHRLFPCGVIATFSMEVAVSAVKAKPGPLDLVRHGYAFDTSDYDPGIDCSGYVDEDGVLHETPSMTRQSDAEDCDINVMMAKYQATGVEPRVNPRSPQWGDFSTVVGFQEAMNIVRQSEEDFALLPAEVRDRFGNDPAGLLRFLENEDNRSEAERLGIVVPPVPEPPPMRVEVVNEGRGETSPPEPAKPA